MNNPHPTRIRPLYVRTCAGFLLLWPVLLLGACTSFDRDPLLYRQILDPQPVSLSPYQPSDPLPLVDALQRANTDNLSIASQGENYIQALADKMVRAGRFLPTISIGPSYSISQSRSSSATPDQFSVPISTSVTGSLANISSLEAATQTIEQRRQLLLDTRQSILLQVAQAYYLVLRNEQQADVLKDSVTVQTERVRDQQARYDLGSVTALELSQSQADLASTRASLTQAQTNAANARSALALLMNVPSVRGSLTDQFEPPADIPDLDTWHHNAKSDRADLLAAAQAVQVAQLNLEAAIRQYFPSVSINFSHLMYADPSSPQLWSAGLSASIPVFSALSIEAQVRSASSSLRQAVLNANLTRNTVYDDINQAHRNLLNSRLRIADLRIQVEAAQRAYQLADQTYQLGSLSNLDRLTQQNNLLNAQLNLITEQFNQKTNYLALLRAAGSLDAILPNHQQPTPVPDVIPTSPVPVTPSTPNP